MYTVLPVVLRVEFPGLTSGSLQPPLIPPPESYDASGFREHCIHVKISTQRHSQKYRYEGHVYLKDLETTVKFLVTFTQGLFDELWRCSYPNQSKFPPLPTW